jgi:DNA-binding MarR family transcriptional regulator
MKIDLDKSVNHRIAMLAVSLKRQVFRLIADNKLDITPDQWVILYYLWEEDGLPVGLLASKTRKDFANATRIIDKLEKQKYVEKRKSETDSRVSHIFLLKKAHDIKESIHKVWEESTEIAMNGIDESEKLVLLHLLDRIENNVLAQNE